MRRRPVVLGAGVVGLLTAKRLSDRGHRVTIVSDAFPLSTTSAAAGSIILPFFPFAPGSQEFTRRMRWTESSLEMYHTFSAGVHCSVVDHVEFCRDGLLEGSFPIEWLPQVNLEGVQVVSLDTGFHGHQQYVRFKLPCVDTLGFLNDLFTSVLSRGVEFVRARITSKSLTELPAESVFNCMGFGSAAVFPDPELVPVFGQVARLEPLGVEFGVGVGEFIGLSTAHNLYVGSLFIAGEHRGVPSRAHHLRLSEFSAEILPAALSLVGVPPAPVSFDRLVEVRAGVRPLRRSGVRLEVEEVMGKTVVHNYGHGAHGWTLAWGSVIDAVELWESLR
ncbi:FAD-dependent oxidoreductase [Streptosporangium sp. NPDC051023]|uniref:FAD-dependent oxidoreductase n=1 Tax=Streptosporangium sp. NPDC051023 TaxID=3155410 RepID=UPI00344B7788